MKNRINSRFALCRKTKKTLKNCISTILQGRFLRLDTLGLVGYFTSSEDISLYPMTTIIYAFFSAIAACAAARRAIGTRNGEQDT